MLPPRTKATAAYLNSALASLEVLENGFDEAVFLTESGNVCEGPGENIFIVKKNKFIYFVVYCLIVGTLVVLFM